MGSCNLVQYQGDLPDIYQNFDNIEGVSARDTGNVMCKLKKRKNLVKKLVSIQIDPHFSTN